MISYKSNLGISLPYSECFTQPQEKGLKIQVCNCPLKHKPKNSFIATTAHSQNKHVADAWNLEIKSKISEAHLFLYFRKEGVIPELAWFDWLVFFFFFPESHKWNWIFRNFMPHKIFIGYLWFLEILDSYSSAQGFPRYFFFSFKCQRGWHLSWETGRD